VRKAVRAALVLVATAAWSACAAERQPEPHALFDCRVPVTAIDRRVEAMHASMAAVRHPARAADLFQFASGKRYAFIVAAGGELRMAPTASDEARNPYSPAVLAHGEPVRAAGGITVVHTAVAIDKVIVDADSAEYCPAVDSLQQALSILTTVGVPPDRIRVDNRPRNCVADVPVRAPMMTGLPGARDYADVMVEIERRFRRLGDALADRHADLADFELVGLLRSAHDDLSQARPPENASADVLEPFARRLIERDLPAVRQAVWDESWREARDAFDAMAATCNDCHAAGHVGFLRVEGSRTPPASSVRSSVR
jgi:hypothetical protein